MDRQLRSRIHGVSGLDLLLLKIFALLVSLTAACAHTASFKDARGAVVPDSVATMEHIKIGGVFQSLWFRTENRNKPALILLHGGPGASESALFRHYNADLERHFLVVYWEQRGTGRSYHSDIPPQSMTLEQFLSDLDEVVELVRQRFHKDKVVLLGHSWGTALGTIYSYRHPEKVSAYAGVAQIANNMEGARRSCEFALAEAERRANDNALNELRAFCPLLRSVDDRLTLGGWVEHFGGMFHGDLSTGKLIWSALNTDEANLVDLIKFGQGNRFSLIHLEAENARLDLSGRYRSFAVPLVFLLGRYDRHVPSELAETYFDNIAAPYKKIVWFEQSAHNPPFEEPKKFNRVLIDEVLPLATAR